MKKQHLLVFGLAIMLLLFLKTRSLGDFSGQAVMSLSGTPMPLPSCSESDGGLNYHVFGRVTGIASSGSLYNYPDLCSTRNQLEEQYCSGTSRSYRLYSCPYGCSSGRCNSAPANNPNSTNATQCNDRRDNDGDSRIDYPVDPGCTSYSDNDEWNIWYQCSDGIDNDLDGYIDYPSDPGCASTTDNDEYNAPPGGNQSNRTSYQCNDRRDNDLDRLIDYPADPGCTSPTDNDEYNAYRLPPPVVVRSATTRSATTVS